MIDRPSRDRLAEALRHYVSGQITNDDLDAVAVDWRDRGEVAVHQMAWGLYTDTYQHRATDAHAIPPEIRRDIARWIAFLYSDREYVWPEYSFLQIINVPMNILTFGWWERIKKRKWEQFVEAGDIRVWPFCSKDELKAILEHPKLLAQKDSQTQASQPIGGKPGSG